MTLNLAISLLRQGRNGEQILSILESIAADEAAPQPTAADLLQYSQFTPRTDAWIRPLL